VYCSKRGNTNYSCLLILMSEAQSTALIASPSAATSNQNNVTYAYPAYYSPYIYPTAYGTYAIDPFTYGAYATPYTTPYATTAVASPTTVNGATPIVTAPAAIINTAGTKRRIEEPLQEPLTSGSKKPRLTNIQHATALSSIGNPNTVFLGNLPNDTTEQAIMNIFSKCGKIKEIRLKKQPDTGKVMGFGFVEYYTAEDAQRALELHGVSLGGRTIKVELSTTPKGAKSSVVPASASTTPLPVMTTLPAAALTAPLIGVPLAVSPLALSGSGPRPTFAVPIAAVPLVSTAPSTLSATPTAIVPPSSPLSMSVTAASGLPLAALAATSHAAPPPSSQLSVARSSSHPLGAHHTHTPATSSSHHHLHNVNPKGTGCRTVFVGNLPDQISDDDIYRTFGMCGEIKEIRWLEDKKTGRFRGCGFVEFYSEDAARRALQLHGTLMYDRAIRVDFAESKSAGGGASNGTREKSQSAATAVMGANTAASAISVASPQPQNQLLATTAPLITVLPSTSFVTSPTSPVLHPQFRNSLTEFQRTHPPGCKTVFIGNLPDTVTDAIIYALFGQCGRVVDVRWLYDKKTGRFKGCGFVEFDSEDATLLAVALNGTLIDGVPMRVDFSVPRAERDHRSAASAVPTSPNVPSAASPFSSSSSSSSCAVSTFSTSVATSASASTSTVSFSTAPCFSSAALFSCSSSPLTSSGSVSSFTSSTAPFSSSSAMLSATVTTASSSPPIASPLDAAITTASPPSSTLPHLPDTSLLVTEEIPFEDVPDSMPTVVPSTATTL
jgi:RNA recognition motif-containing protein